MTKVIIRQGKENGPTTIVMGGVHGNERTGLGVINRFIDSGRIPSSGKVIFIIANEQAIIENVRYIDKDLNRCFGISDGSYGNEQSIARNIETYIQESDYLLDIHNTTNPKSESFLICEHDMLSSFFNVNKSISGLDILHPGGSDGYGNSVGCKSVCLEAGSIYDDLENSIARCEDQVLNFLVGVGNYSGEAEVYSPNKSIYTVQYKTKTNFEPIEGIKDFQEFEKGELIGRDGEDEILAPFDGVCIFAYTKNSSNEEGFVYGRKFD